MATRVRRNESDDLLPNEEIGDEADELLETIYSLVKLDETRRAIDVAYEYFFAHIRSHSHRNCDRVLELADVGQLNSTLMVAFLSVTLPIKQELKGRRGFYQRVVDALTQEKGEERAAKLLEKYR